MVAGLLDQQMRRALVVVGLLAAAASILGLLWSARNRPYIKVRLPSGQVYRVIAKQEIETNDQRGIGIKYVAESSDAGELARQADELVQAVRVEANAKECSFVVILAQGADGQSRTFQYYKLPTGDWVSGEPPTER